MASPLDTTGVGIVAGILATSAYSLIRILRQRSFDIGTILLMFLAGFSIPGGAHLIRAAWSGNPNDLPSNWREYVTVAGIAAIGLSVQYLVQSFRNVWPKRAAISSVGEQPNEESRANDPDPAS